MKGFKQYVYIAVRFLFYNSVTPYRAIAARNATAPKPQISSTSTSPPIAKEKPVVKKAARNALKGVIVKKRKATSDSQVSKPEKTEEKSADERSGAPAKRRKEATTS